ncbi:hypothetical protein KSS87_019893 [Heliosperma pusillum]|nr:hypothetical protein KSS87_008023 [Heliosperma pusillum]KAH9615165.1 hypothetical protein KSS87_004963 [Heliosperma pusillum]KAH9615221.1 hypothetical protein KSS87_019893 [Heliosperma pusillum]
MNMSGYGWSSGSESGWTGYLDESYNPRNEYNYNYSVHTHSYDVEEDLSMVSDASSGPQQLSMASQDESYRISSNENCLSTAVKLSKKSSGKKSKKSSGKEHKLSNHQNHQLSYSSNNHLDDTASSPALTYSKVFDNPSCNQASVDHFMSFPQGISEGHFQESSSYTNHYGFWQPTLPKDTHSVEPSNAFLPSL